MKKLFLAALLLSLSVCAFAQQDYVGRYDAYAGFSYLDTPNLNLLERGFITQEGVNLNRWLAFGFDFSVMVGHSTILPVDIKPSVISPLLPLLPPGGFPAGFGVPYDSSVYTYTAGPQLNYRKFKRITLFVHPDVGAIHATATAKTPSGPFAGLETGLLSVPSLHSGKLKDTTYFYGAGGGFQFHATKHIGVRFTYDYVHVYLFSDLLANSRNASRFSVGPYFNIGKNVSR